MTLFGPACLVLRRGPFGPSVLLRPVKTCTWSEGGASCPPGRAGVRRYTHRRPRRCGPESRRLRRLWGSCGVPSWSLLVPLGPSWSLLVPLGVLGGDGVP